MDDQKWINKHPGIIIFITATSLLILLATLVVIVLRERDRERDAEYERLKREYAWSKRVSEKWYPEKDANSVIRGKLIFEKIPLRVRERSGKISRLKKRGRTIKCGDSLDVMWFPTEILFMKEKGVFEKVPVADDARSSDLEWDGQNLWLSIPKKGIWILDTSGQIVTKIDSKSGLPPGEKGLLLHLIEPGKIFAVGSFGRFGRGWCAIVEYKNGEPSVNIFHEAKRVSTKKEIEDNEEEIKRDPFVVFRPYQIRERWPGGRRKLFIRRCEKKYSDHPLIFPLEIDLDALSVRISSQKTASLKRSSSRLKYNGKVYVPGRVWERIDPNTHRRETLVTQGRLPDPYGSLGNYWVSAHYGLVGWTGNQELYQIRITDEEHDIIAESSASKGLYFHTFAFEDANGSPFKLRGVDHVRIAIRRRGQPTLNYKYNPTWPRGYFPPGTYKVWGTTIDSLARVKKVCEFEPLEVTENSPVRLVFKVSEYRPIEVTKSGLRLGPKVGPKVKPDQEILYCGQVVNAITRKPMVGAFVMQADNRNLAWITSEEWDELRKLPLNPSLRDEALWPIKNTSPFPLKGIARTDPSGRFEISLKSSYKFYSFIAFEENYLSAEVSHFDFPAIKNGRIELPPMRLFPAAKIIIEPYVECSNVRLRFIPEGDAGYNRPRLSTRIEGYVRQPCHVPVGSTFKMKFSIPYEDKWCIPDIPQTINLKQGETLDLGRFVFEPAIRIYIKMLDSAGKPAEGFSVIRSYDDPYHNVRAHKTNEAGKASFYVEPNSEVAFTVYRDVRTWQVLKTVTFKIGGREDEGKVFTVQF